MKRRGSFSRGAPAPFRDQELAPLRLGQVLLDEGKHLAFLVRQVGVLPAPPAHAFAGRDDLQRPFSYRG
jgi:hypothetical protein